MWISRNTQQKLLQQPIHHHVGLAGIARTEAIAQKYHDVAFNSRAADNHAKLKGWWQKACVLFPIKRLFIWFFVVIRAICAKCFPINVLHSTLHTPKWRARMGSFACMPLELSSIERKIKTLLAAFLKPQVLRTSSSCYSSKITNSYLLICTAFLLKMNSIQSW